MDSIAAEWRRNRDSEHDWELDGMRGPMAGELDGVWLKPCQAAPYGAYFKPTNRKCSFPAAAREKIAADLAHDVAVPVAPVLLVKSGGRFGAVQEECCVSLVTHEDTNRWDWIWPIVKTPGNLGALARAAAANDISRIAVFDLWIDNRDRNNAGNVIFGTDLKNPARSGFRALDHARSMGDGGSWINGQWSSITRTPFPEDMRVTLDMTVMLGVVKRIEELPEDTIRQCVNRIPENYMDSRARNDTVSGLIGRKKDLRASVLLFLK